MHRDQEVKRLEEGEEVYVSSRCAILIFSLSVNLKLGLLITFYKTTHYIKPSVSQAAHNVPRTFTYGPILVETFRTIIGPKLLGVLGVLTYCGSSMSDIHLEPHNIEKFP